MKLNTDNDLRKQQLKLIMILFIGLFVLILAYTIIWEINYNNKYGFFVKTEAEIIDHSGSDDEVYDVLEYKIDNVTYHKTTSYLSKNEIGDKITIYYDKTNPIGVIYSIDIKKVLLPIITTVFGVVCVLLVIIYYNLFLHNSIQSSEKSDSKADSLNNKINTNITQNKKILLSKSNQYKNKISTKKINKK